LIPADAKGQVGTKGLSCCLSTCGRKPIRLWSVPWSSACILRLEFWLGTCERSTFKTCPLSCMPASAACPVLTMGYASSCSDASAHPHWNIHHRRCWDQVAVAQTTIIIAAQRLTPSRCNSPAINGSAMLESGIYRIPVDTAYLRRSPNSPFTERGPG
jgi:hypothetical protein